MAGKLKFYLVVIFNFLAFAMLFMGSVSKLNEHINKTIEDRFDKFPHELHWETFKADKDAKHKPVVTPWMRQFLPLDNVTGSLEDTLPIGMVRVIEWNDLWSLLVFIGAIASFLSFLCFLLIGSLNGACCCDPLSSYGRPSNAYKFMKTLALIILAVSLVAGALAVMSYYFKIRPLNRKYIFSVMNADLTTAKTASDDFEKFESFISIGGSAIMYQIGVALSLVTFILSFAFVKYDVSSFSKSYY